MVRAALDAVDAGRLVERALSEPGIRSVLQAAPGIDVIAAGKASSVMAHAFVRTAGVPLRAIVGAGPAMPDVVPDRAEWFVGGHPLPTPASVDAARRACDLARASRPGDLLVVLLSGGGSALMALPAGTLSLEAKQQTARRLMESGADIYELNTVRKHLSAVKGGQLAAVCGGTVLTLAISDVVGDDLSVIASGPTHPDESTYGGALDVLDRHGGRHRYAADVVSWLERGAAGALPETPAHGDPRLARATARVIGPQRGAIDGARAAAELLGYHVHVVPEPITGEARAAGAAHAETLDRLAARLKRPACVISAGETTVTVVGQGRGGRNQEFAFGLADALASGRVHGAESVAAASIGTDGIDGPTDAAGALVDPRTFERARAAGLAPQAYLADNNTYAFFDRIGDLVRTGPTNTNVGDLQVVLLD